MALARLGVAAVGLGAFFLFGFVGFLFASGPSTSAAVVVACLLATVVLSLVAYRRVEHRLPWALAPFLPALIALGVWQLGRVADALLDDPSTDVGLAAAYARHAGRAVAATELCIDRPAALPGLVVAARRDGDECVDRAAFYGGAYYGSTSAARVDVLLGSGWVGASDERRVAMAQAWLSVALASDERLVVDPADDCRTSRGPVRAPWGGVLPDGSVRVSAFVASPAPHGPETCSVLTLEIDRDGTGIVTGGEPYGS